MTTASRRYDRQNVALLLGVVVSWLLLLKAASSGGAVFVLAAIAFAMVGLTLDGLMHQSFHGNLHSAPATNAVVGAIACAFFPGSFTLLREAHASHHRHNRTDHEMFDLYYASDNKLLKVGHWYGVLVGLYAISMPLFSLGVALCPRLFKTRWFTGAKTTGPLFGGEFFTKAFVRRIRLEVLGGALFWTAAFFWLALEPLVVAALYAAFWLNWSTRNYMGHAFSTRHVIEGAHDLETGSLHSGLMLHSNFELTHHRHPSARWQELPRLALPSASAIGYWRQWARMWGGPRPTSERAPAPLPDLSNA